MKRLGVLNNSYIQFGLIIFLLFFFVSVPVSAEQNLYSTWDVLELDTCASAWLIKKFVNKEAEFKFYPKGEFILEGIPFDTPDAKWKRSQKLSTFETILLEYKIKDEKLKALGEMIHEIEINYWAGKMSPEASALNEKIKIIIDKKKAQGEALAETFIVFDEFYQK